MEVLKRKMLKKLLIHELPKKDQDIEYIINSPEGKKYTDDQIEDPTQDAIKREYDKKFNEIDDMYEKDLEDRYKDAPSGPSGDPDREIDLASFLERKKRKLNG